MPKKEYNRRAALAAGSTGPSGEKNGLIAMAMGDENASGGESEGEYKLSPEQQKQVDNYVDNALLMIHGEQTRDDILNTLTQHVKNSNGNPQAAVAIVANIINDKILVEAEKQGVQFNEVALSLGSAVLVGELIQIGEAAGLFKMDEAQKVAAYQLALQYFFGRGINNGTIDPVQLQKSLEPLMPPDTRAKGEAVARSEGIPVSNGGVATATGGQPT